MPIKMTDAQGFAVQAIKLTQIELDFALFRACPHRSRLLSKVGRIRSVLKNGLKSATAGEALLLNQVHAKDHDGFAGLVGR
jgi:hypothetical protein